MRYKRQRRGRRYSRASMLPLISIDLCLLDRRVLCRKGFIVKISRKRKVKKILVIKMKNFRSKIQGI